MPEYEDKAVLVQNRVDRHAIQALAVEGEAFSDDFDGLRLVTVGRLSHEKGVYKIPEIIDQLRALNQPFRWYLLGDGPLTEALKQAAQSRPELVLLGSRANPYVLV